MVNFNDRWQKKTKCKSFSMFQKKCSSDCLKQRFPTGNICYQAAKKEAERRKIQREIGRNRKGRDY